MRNEKGQFMKGINNGYGFKKGCKQISYVHKSSQGFQKGHGLLGNNLASKGKHWKLSEENKKNISEGRKGIKFSKEHIEKLRQSHIGNTGFWLGKKRLPTSEETRKKIGDGNRGKIVSEETRQKIRELKYFKDRTQLKKSEDRRNSAYNNWRQEVYKRDYWKCKINNNECNGRIEAHHIFNWRDYPELRYVIGNGITLCHFHHPFTKKEENKLSPYFKNLINENING